MPEVVRRLPRRDAADPPPAGSVMMALGRFSFGVSTAAHQRLRRQTAYRWASLDRLGRRPAHQFVGPGPERISLTGTILAELGDHSSPNTLRALAASGESQPLVDGAGRVCGPWIITNISETQELFFADGTPRKRSFTVELARYGEDAG